MALIYTFICSVLGWDDGLKCIICLSEVVNTDLRGS